MSEKNLCWLIVRNILLYVIVVFCLKVLFWSIYVVDDVINIIDYGGKYKNFYYEGYICENVFL